jgi:lipid A 3-O-deacylase
MLHRSAFGGLVALLLAMVSPPAKAQDPSFLTFGAGAFDFMEGDHRAAQVDLQYRSGLKLWIFQPMVGVSATTDAAGYIYAGLSVDIFFGNRFVLRPSFAPGLFYEGNGKDLGGVLEFRSAVEAAYRFDDRSRLGIEISHRSNAGFYDDNPGEETLMLFYHLPLTGR